MCKIKVLALLIFFLGWGNSAQAILTNNGNGTITDTNSGLMWLQNSTLKQGITWNEANAWVDSLTVGGFDDWRLASALDSNGVACLGFNCTDTELGSLFYGALGNVAGNLSNSGIFNIDLNNTWFWTATNSGLACGFFGCINQPYYFRFEAGEQTAGGFIWEINPLNGWAVRSVPEPPVWVLMALGLLVIGRQYFQKRLV